MHVLRWGVTVVAAGLVVAISGCAAPGQPAHDATGSGLATSAPAQSVAASTSALSVVSSPMASPPADVSTPTTAPSPAPPSVVPVDETGVVPWVDVRGTMFLSSPLPVAPLPTSGRACRAADLRVSDVGGNGGGGHSYATFEFVDTSPTPCVLKGYPRVVATEPGKPAVVAVNGGYFVGQEKSAAMTPGVSTSLDIETERDCDARYAVPNPWPTLIYHTATVTIPGGGVVVLHDVFDVECGLFTGQFGVAQPQPEYTQSVIQGATARIELPSAVDAGATLHYVIDLTNPTANDMTLAPCPSYQQEIGEAGKDPLEFNCSAVHLLLAHHTQRFAMELPVPADYPTGQAEVYWNVAATTDISARGSVDVIGADTPCASNQLTVAITGPGTVPGLPNMMGLKGYATAVPLALTNRSNATCSVRGTPAVDLRAGDGTDLGLPQADEQAMHITGPRMPSPTVVLAPGDVATTTLYWYSDFCGSDPNPLTVTLTLPTNGATVEATPAGGWRPPPCPDGPPGHGQVGADPFQAS
ncbi:MAG TPA: DUF4232 domain-containing protein [Acidothermaceae bacterium]